jgi:MFS family permease
MLTRDMKLFWTCFISLIATSFGFMVRVNVMDDWAKQFGLSDTQKGEIFGVGLWPFAISIVLFSLIIDKIGYKIAMVFAFICHAGYMALVMLTPDIAGDNKATAYWCLYFGSLIGALGNGTIEAVINPVVATMFNRDKTKWLNILHAGWPGGLVLAGVLALSMGEGVDWRYKIGLVGLPVLLYGALTLTCQFPVNERVAAGVSFRDMLKEVGFFGAFLVSALIVFEVSNVFVKLVGTMANAPDFLKNAAESLESVKTVWSSNLPLLGDVSLAEGQALKFGIAGAIALVFGLYTLSVGSPLFVFLMLIMMPLAITELGTDSWIGELMGPEMKKLGLKGDWVLVYTSLIMAILRFCAGPIVHRLSPLGLLALSAAIAAMGLFSLSLATGAIILAAATLYGFGKTFFWPTMLGVVSEQFPKGGALTLNAISGLGMMAVGIIGNPLLGNVQDKEVDRKLGKDNTELHAKITGESKKSIFGEYQPLDEKKVEALGKDEKEIVSTAKSEAKKNALKTVAIFPVGMLIAYLLLLGYFKMKGGYKPEELPGASGSNAGH